MFIGREDELHRLRTANWRDSAQLSVVYGRRRVGKTRLIEEAYKNENIWKFEGIEGSTTRKQIEHFLFILSEYSSDREINKNIKTWQEAFLILHKKLTGQNKIIFFDEFQWMACMRKSMVSVFKWAWDNYLSKHTNCRFIICGSISSFIVRQVIKSSALHGRIHTEIHLKSFSLPETTQLLQKHRSMTEPLNAQLVFGGIPQYLIELDPKKSLIQNLDYLAFSPNGYFFREYQRLFISHFSHNPIYEKILQSLSKKQVQTIHELAASVGTRSGGTFTKILEDLELAGFIQRFHPIDKKKGSKLIRIRIQDEFLHFYFYFLEKMRDEIEEKSVKANNILTGPMYYQWQGYAFERLCRKNAKRIAEALQFSGIQHKFGSWFSAKQNKRAQIDLLFQRADKVFTVCEIKFVNNLDSRIINEFTDKLSALQAHYTWKLQKVLILGKRIPVPDKVEQYFDRILFAEDIFL